MAVGKDRDARLLDQLNYLGGIGFIVEGQCRALGRRHALVPALGQGLAGHHLQCARGRVGHVIADKVQIAVKFARQGKTHIGVPLLGRLPFFDPGNAADDIGTEGQRCPHQPWRCRTGNAILGKGNHFDAQPALVFFPNFQQPLDGSQS